MIALTARTKDHVATLFAPADGEAAMNLLLSDCGSRLPFLTNSSPESLERVRFAVLRISGGDLDRLRSAVALAKSDWRDVLVAAGFAEDVKAHSRWTPRRFGADVVATWKGGAVVEGVAFAHGSKVEVAGRSTAGAPGVVVGLTGLEPEPRYLVVFDKVPPVELPEGRLVRSDKTKA